MDTLKIAILWSNMTGYASACYRELSSRPGVKLKIISYGENKGAPFAKHLVEGLDWTPLSEAQKQDAAYIASVVKAFEPDFMVLPGWINKAYVKVAGMPEFASVPKMICSDAPWLSTVRNQLARFALAGFFAHIDRIAVIGERAWQYAVRLGFKERQIRRGMWAADTAYFEPVLEERLKNGPWPRQFVFAGRYVPAKGLDVLIQAYKQYRSAVSNPWTLACCGVGPMGDLIRSTEGVKDHGYLQPDGLRKLFLESGVFVFSSLFEPWGLALVEAGASGLPQIATEACGGQVELIRGEYSGYTVATGDADALTRALIQAHNDYERLPLYGKRAQQLAAPYSCQIWADRYIAWAKEAIEERRLRSTKQS